MSRVGIVEILIRVTDYVESLETEIKNVGFFLCSHDPFVSMDGDKKPLFPSEEGIFAQTNILNQKIYLFPQCDIKNVTFTVLDVTCYLVFRSTHMSSVETA